MKVVAPLLFVLCASVIAPLTPIQATEPSAAGLWGRTDHQGRDDLWLLFRERDGLYEGAVAKAFFRPDEDHNPICAHCKGELKNQPVLGLTIITGMVRRGLAYGGGSVLDFRDGMSYPMTMEISGDGNVLELRTRLGVHGHIQFFKRLPDGALPVAEMPPNLRPGHLPAQRPPLPGN